MTTEAVQGLADAYAMFGRLPDAAREQLGVELAILGREALQAQKAATPVGETGELRAGLSLQLLIDQLRVRVGLLLSTSGPSLFYGPIVNFGRAARTVLVQRRRRVDGQLRLTRRRKRVEDIVATYSLRVKAREGVPFIDAPGQDFDRVAAGQLAEFWSRTLARAEA